MWRQPFPIDGALDDDLMAGVGQAVERAVAQDGVVEEAQPFVHGPVAGDDEAGRPMAVEDQFVEIGGLFGGEEGQVFWRWQTLSNSATRRVAPNTRTASVHLCSWPFIGSIPVGGRIVR